MNQELASHYDAPGDLQQRSQGSRQILCDLLEAKGKMLPRTLLDKVTFRPKVLSYVGVFAIGEIGQQFTLSGVEPVMKNILTIDLEDANRMIVLGPGSTLRARELVHCKLAIEALLADSVTSNSAGNVR